MDKIFTLKISQPFQDLDSTPDHELPFVGGYDTLKIAQTGELTLRLPEQLVAFMISDTYTATVPHNLGYIPYVEPTTLKFWSTWGLDTAKEIIVNEYIQLNTLTIPAVEPTIGESVEVSVTASNLTLKVVRVAELIEQDFSAKEFKLFYNIYYNDVGNNFSI